MRYELTAQRIREAMEDLGMTQQELADKSQIGKSSISHYVNGSNEPGNKSAYALAQALNVNPAWLMGLDAPKELKSRPGYSIQVETVSGETIVVEFKDNVIPGTEKDIIEAIDLYKKYKKAIPQVQDAVEALLKPPQSDP